MSKNGDITDDYTEAKDSAEKADIGNGDDEGNSSDEFDPSAKHSSLTDLNDLATRILVQSGLPKDKRINFRRYPRCIHGTNNDSIMTKYPYNKF
jgi:hypothetical protein